MSSFDERNSIYMSSAHQKDNLVCQLCLHFEAECKGDCFTVAKCGHVYHKNCIRTYVNKGSNLCPVCNHSLNLKKLRKIYCVDPDPSCIASLGNVASSSSYTEQVTHTFKIVLIGSAGSGKTCLLKKFNDKSFNTSVNNTTSLDLLRKKIEVGDEEVQLIIWDTMGQEKFQSLISTCVRDAQGVILVYDVGDLDSFHALESWWEFAIRYAPQETVKALVGNKIDRTQIIPTSEGESLAQSLMIPYFETSAKDGRNVELLFRTVTAKILENDWIMAGVRERQHGSTLKLNRTNYEGEQEVGCFGRIWNFLFGY